MIKSLGFKTKSRSQKYKKARYAIRYVSEKDIYKIIREFEKFEKLSYEKKRPKHEPTESYFHLARQLAKCMMIYDNLNWYDHGGYTEKTASSSNVYVTNEGESKHSIVHEKLSQSYFTNKKNQNAVSSTKLYRGTVPQKRTNYVLRRKRNHNVRMRNKNMQRMRLRMM